MTDRDPVRIECVETGCAGRIDVHWRHARNFEDRYRCPNHDQETD